MGAAPPNAADDAEYDVVELLRHACSSAAGLAPGP